MMGFKRFSFLLVLLVVIFTGETAMAGEWDTAFKDAKKTVAMRDIAHRLLWYAGDSTSRVLPVEQPAKGKYLLRFESPFSFDPDSLVSIVDRGIRAGGFPSEYIVNVMDCASSSVVFGYAILENGRDNIVPCEGREQPRQCYAISIMFTTTSEAAGGRFYYLIVAGLLAVPLWVFGKRVYSRGRKPAPDASSPAANRDAVALGAFQFYARQQVLVNNADRIALTAKESKLLAVFVGNINVVIDRNRLQKEVWEDEGVIVGRSLDMFVSRLRKKLQKDSTIRLVNIHGLGYKLEVNGLC